MRFLLLFALPSFLITQWPQQAGDRVDLSAPPRKAPDGHPDLTGVSAREKISPEPASREPFLRISDAVAGGLPIRPWAEQLAQSREARSSVDHPDAHCLPLHPIQLHYHPYPRKIVQTSNLILIIYEANSGLRQIFLDGRSLPDLGDLQPWWYGYSVGHWDGDTLVVESTGFRNESWFDETAGTPGSDALRMTERIRRPSLGLLDIEITVDDPKAYTKPWSFRTNYTLMPGAELIEYICGENEQSVKHFAK